MAKLTSAIRSRIVKAAWKRRKPLGMDPYTKRPIFVGGVMHRGQLYHKTSLAAMRLGIPAEVVANPGRWHAPLDPSCPVVKRYTKTLYEDPMGRAMGAPLDEIYESFERKHRVTCKRCLGYGAKHIGIEYNPFRPRLTPYTGPLQPRRNPDEDLLMVAWREGLVSVVFTDYTKRGQLDRLVQEGFLKKIKKTRSSSPWHDSYALTAKGKTWAKQLVQPRRNPVTYETFTNYYGGIDNEALALEYAEKEKDPDYKAMFLRLAEELRKGVRYVPYSSEGGHLVYRRRRNPRGDRYVFEVSFRDPEGKIHTEHVFARGSKDAIRIAKKGKITTLTEWRARLLIGTEALKGYPKLQNPLAYGPTGFRPPAAWFAKMLARMRAGYRKRKGQSEESYKDALGRIVGGIWSKFSDATRRKILLKYEPAAARAKGLNPLMGHCPVHGGDIAVNPTAKRVKCSAGEHWLTMPRR